MASTISGILYADVTSDRRITLAEAKDSIDGTLKLEAPHKSVEAALWEETELHRDMFDPDALAYVENRLNERIGNMWAGGETAGQWFARSVLRLKTDTDQDGLTDRQEKALHTNPFVADTDHDGVSDKAEVKAGSNPGVVTWK